MSLSNNEAVAQYVDRWIKARIDDSSYVLGKPLLLTEFGKSSRSPGYQVVARETYLPNIYNSIYTCARTNGTCGGALFWQLMAQGMENLSDGYEIVLEQSPSTVGVIAQQSNGLSSLI
ncbi:hypothetical protein ACH5RR_012675 [Cinchona calisaya]|uniref:Mannan endo-1,4-beta-mannosidase n=1 Tax=Cinchona calisaya TaxID=153742 RepID=A0ABD3A9X1_9GENT